MQINCNSSIEEKSSLTESPKIKNQPIKNNLRLIVLSIASILSIQGCSQNYEYVSETHQELDDLERGIYSAENIPFFKNSTQCKDISNKYFSSIYQASSRLQQAYSKDSQIFKNLKNAHIEFNQNEYVGLINSVLYSEYNMGKINKSTISYKEANKYACNISIELAYDFIEKFKDENAPIIFKIKEELESGEYNSEHGLFGTIPLFNKFKNEINLLNHKKTCNNSSSELYSVRRSLINIVDLYSNDSYIINLINYIIEIESKKGNLEIVELYKKEKDKFYKIQPIIDNIFKRLGNLIAGSKYYCNLKSIDKQLKSLNNMLEIVEKSINKAHPDMKPTQSKNTNAEDYSLTIENNSKEIFHSISTDLETILQILNNPPSI